MERSKGGVIYWLLIFYNNPMDSAVRPSQHRCSIDYITKVLKSLMSLQPDSKAG